MHRGQERWNVEHVVCDHDKGGEVALTRVLHFWSAQHSTVLFFVPYRASAQYAYTWETLEEERWAFFAADVVLRLQQPRKLSDSWGGKTMLTFS